MPIFARVLPRTRLLVTLLGVGVLAACGSDVLAPFSPAVGNVADNFQLQATNLTDVSWTVVYPWVNSGTRATINHSTATTSGSTLLVIKDATGAVVYSKPLSASLNEPTSTGQTGTWWVTLTLTHFSGTINFRAQKL